jgi:hypothetical protein
VAVSSPVYYHAYMNNSLDLEYYNNLEKLKNNEISQEEWYKFCQEILTVIMEENKDVFVRLKNR